jgi:hypothetical protein
MEASPLVGTGFAFSCISFFDAPILGPIDKVPAAGIFGYRCANLHNLPGLDASKDLAGSDFFRLHFGNL